MNIGIIGCGWLGLRIAKHLEGQHTIYATTTSTAKAEELSKRGYKTSVIEFNDHQILNSNAPWNTINQLNVIIITVPFSRWAQKEKLTNRFNNIINFIRGFQGQVFIMSSTGIYPQVAENISEDTFPDNDLHPNLIFVENLMREKFPYINILRLGGLMGDDRQLSSYNISDTTGIVNHVHYEDICWVIQKMIEKEITSKTYNVVAPLHPTKQEVISQQKDIPQNIFTPTKGRKVLSDKLQQELDYQFHRPDPTYFK